ncbi:MAG: hypothetical protein J7647_30275 [Cyanobacteria bacterium SBLK]|nr:hypothetical protein [Cyanobacteria bacterium SBLK]
MSKSEVLGTSSYLEIAQKNYEEMFGSELPERDRLYGTHLAVQYELLDENGHGVLIDNQVPGRFNDNFYVYRWIDAVGATEAFKEQGAIAAFHEKTENNQSSVIWTFDPATANDPNNPNSAKYIHRDRLEIMVNGFKVGQLGLQGSATESVEIGLDLDGFKNTMTTEKLRADVQSEVTQLRSHF